MWLIKRFPSYQGLRELDKKVALKSPTFHTSTVENMKVVIGKKHITRHCT